MRPVYEAANSADAYLVKNLLEQADIAAMIRGEYLQGGLGDLPVGGLIQVCVIEADYERARKVIHEWQRIPVPEDAETREPAPVRRSAAGPMLAGLLAGALLSGLLVWALMRDTAAVAMLDHNDDGRADEQATYDGEVLKRIDHDRNFDGVPDEIFYYQNGIVASIATDDDFDGRPETRTRFVRGSWQSSETDRDGDGTTEYRADAINGVLYSEEWLDSSERVIKRDIYKDGWPVSGEIDTDGDGTLDRKRRYNALMEIENNVPVAQ